MKLQYKLSVVVVISIVASIVLSALWLATVGTKWTKGYNFKDLNGISDTIAQTIEQAESVTDNTIRQMLTAYAEQYEGIDFEWVRRDGSLLYSSIGRQVDYSFEEMMDRFNYVADKAITAETYSLPYRISIGEDSAFLLLTVQDYAAREMQVYIYVTNYFALIILYTPLLIVILVPVFSSIMYNAFVNRRIRRLHRVMEQTDLNNLKHSSFDRSRDEIGQLGRLFNQMAEKINSQLAHINQVEQQRKQLIFNLSHDLRTPLTYVLGYAENLVHRDALHEPPIDQWLLIILDKSRYIKQLSDRLFEVSLYDQQQLAVSRESCNMTELIGHIALDYALILEEQNIEPDIRLQHHDIWLQIDPIQIERAVRNLIDNAIKYGAEGHYLGIGLEENAKKVMIVVRDRGKGIPADEQNSIFEPFYRLQKERHSDSFGIGLSIVAEIAAAHGGTVTVESKPHMETVFTITLNKI